MDFHDDSSDLKTLLEEAGIDPMVGDCYCVASAIQKVIDPRLEYTAILCVKTSPYNDDIKHCMVRNLANGVFYDAEGAHDPREIASILSEYNVDDECIPDENGDFHDEDCVDERNYKDTEPRGFSCARKIEIVERIIRDNMPSWLKKQYDTSSSSRISVGREGISTTDPSHDASLKGCSRK